MDGAESALEVVTAFSYPRTPVPLTLVVVQGRRSGEVYSFGADRPVLIGSSPQAHVRLPDRGVAGVHARLAPLTNGSWEVLAAPGLAVVVNSTATSRATLKLGDRLEVGEAAVAISACTRSATDRLPQQPTPPPDAPPVMGAVHFLNGPSKGRVVPLGPATTLGRAPTADIPLLDARCSRVHARIERTPRGFVLLDMGSTNGTRLNGQTLAPATARALESGDWIQTGSTVLEFHLGPEAARLRETHHGSDEDELPLDDIARRAPTDKMPTTQQAPRPLAAVAVLAGDLRGMQFADVVQFLNMARKTGDLVIQHPTGEWRLSFHEGNVVHARGPHARPPMQTFQAMARLDQGRFEFREGTPPEEVTLRSSTQALLLEALRLVDEQTDIQGIVG